jgi:acyl-CoA synthetase (AMP-forming)/AMP-acid ligase II
MRVEWLLDRFAQNRDRPFIVWRNCPYSYTWLLASIERWQRRLDDAAVANGMVVSVEGDYSPEVVALVLALIQRDAVLVPLTASIEAQKPEFRRIAEVQLAIGFDDSEGSITHFPGVAVNSSLTRQLLALREPGLVLFSSGSTGKSKAALHDLSRLLEKFQTTRPTFVTLTFLLLDHIGGINTLLHTLSCGGTIVSVESRDPDSVCQAIQDQHVELLPTSPTFLNLLLISEAYRRYDLSSLKKVTYGTEVMPERTLQRLHAIFPHVTLQQTYGLSEIGILRSKSRSSDSLWVKLGGEGYQLKVVDDTLWVRARSSMLGYLNAPSPFDEDGWFNTGDCVEVDGEYVRILGRRSELINVGGLKVYPVEVENVLMQMPNVRDAVVVGEPNPITGQIVVAQLNLLEPEDPAQLRKRVRAFCRERLAAYKIPSRVEILAVDQFSARFKKMRRREG